MTALVRLCRQREAAAGLLRHAGVAVRRDGRAAHVLLNRPERLNALDHAAVMLLCASLEDLADDPGVEVVVLAGAGSRGLCAGGDLLDLYEDAISGSGRALAFWRDLYELVELVASYPKPIVALMDGVTFGGGLGVGSRAAVRVVTERSVLGMPETRIGFYPDAGGLHLLSRLPGEVGTYLGLCAQTVGASDALAVGLADRFVWSTDLAALADRLAVEPWEDALAVFTATPPEQPLLPAAWVEECFAGDDAEVIGSRLLSHPGRAARDAGAVLAGRSPTAVRVALWGLRAAAGLSLAEDLDLELRLTARLCRSHDFLEGVRARLVDKDRDPRWSPSRLTDVDLGWLGEVLETVA
jgi:enoyl-CoA hydratase